MVKTYTLKLYKNGVQYGEFGPYAHKKDADADARALKAKMGRGGRVEVRANKAADQREVIWPGKGGKITKAAAPKKGDEVAVFFNLSAQYSQKYGARNKGLLESEARQAEVKIKKQARQQFEAGDCVRSTPKWSQIYGMSRSGAVYSVQYPPHGRTAAHARAVEIENVVFTTSGSVIRSIRESGKKQVCCKGVGTLVAWDKQAERNLKATLKAGGGMSHAVIVGLNPMRNDTFVVMYAGPESGWTRGEPVLTAKKAFFVNNDRARPGAPPGAVYVFGIGAVDDDSAEEGRLYRTSCESPPIRGIRLARANGATLDAMVADIRKPRQWVHYSMVRDARNWDYIRDGRFWVEEPPENIEIESERLTAPELAKLRRDPNYREQPRIRRNTGVKRNTHLAVGQLAKYSQAHLDWVRDDSGSVFRYPRATRGTVREAKAARFIIDAVWPKSYNVTDLNSGEKLTLGDFQLVAADSDTRKFPGTGYKGRKPRTNPDAKWLQEADADIEAAGTEGSFTKQARRAGYKDTMEFARKVMAGWRSGKKKVWNKREKRWQGVTVKTMRRANFAINAQKSRRRNG